MPPQAPYWSPHGAAPAISVTVPYPATAPAMTAARLKSPLRLKRFPSVTNVSSSFVSSRVIGSDLLLFLGFEVGLGRQSERLAQAGYLAGEPSLGLELALRRHDARERHGAHLP